MMMQQKRLHNRLLKHIPNKRLMIARVAGALGILHLLEFITTRRKPVIAVLTYHRIAVPNDSARPYYDPVISATPESFQTQIKLLAQRFQILTLQELLCLQAGDQPHKYFKKPGVLITFDDGYRDNFEIALPLLQSYGVPATFFITTKFLEDPGLPWWDHVAYVLKTTNVPTLCLERFKGDKEPFHVGLGPDASTDARARAVRTVIDHFLDDSIADHPWFLDQLNTQAEVEIDPRAAGRELFMGWDEVREVSRAGMSIGSHGHTHLALAKLDEVMQRIELTISRTLLKNGTGKEVQALAYPFGWNQTYSTCTQKLAAEVGYHLGFSSMEGINTLASLRREPMGLRRLNVGTGDSALLLRARFLSYGTLGRSTF